MTVNHLVGGSSPPGRASPLSSNDIVVEGKCYLALLCRLGHRADETKGEIMGRAQDAANAAMEAHREAARLRAVAEAAARAAAEAKAAEDLARAALRMNNGGKSPSSN